MLNSYDHFTYLGHIMLCYIYKSLKKEELYLFVDKKDDFSSVPESLLISIGAPAFVMELEITAESKLARQNARQVLQQIQEQGFFLQLPPTQVAGSETIQ